MEWVTAIASTLDLIERELLSEELTMIRISREVGISESHLQRAFSILTGMAIGDYIRRRRLTLAAQELATSDIRVIDLAMKYLYETPEAFNKAFRRQHGISPMEARRPEATLNACTRLTIEVKVKGAPSMNYKLVEKEGFQLIGEVIKTTTENEHAKTEIPAFWGKAHQSGLVEKLCGIKNMEGLVGACIMETPNSSDFEYGICAILPEAEQVQKTEMDVRTVPPLTWAVFECVGPMPNAIQETFHKIYAEWFPATGYEHAAGPELEVYPPGDVTSEDYYCEVWIPIVKK